MVRQFFRVAVLQLSLNLIVKGVYLFGIDRVVQNVLPEEDYGLYFALLGFGMLLQVIADFGLQLYNSRMLSGHRQLLAKYFPYFVGLKIILGLLFFGALLLLGLVLGYREEALLLLIIAGGVQLMNSLVLYLRSNLSGLGRFRLDGWFSIADKSIMIVGVGGMLLLAPGQLTIWHFAGWQLFSWAITAGALLIVLRGKLTGIWPKFHWATFRVLLRGGAPYALAVFLATAYTRADAVMIERLLVEGAEAAAHYAAGYRLLDAMNMFGWLLAGLLLPMYARMYVRQEDWKPLLRFSTRLLVSTALIIAVPLAFYAAPVVELLYDFAEARTGHILVFLSLSFVAQCLNYAYGALLSGTALIGRMNRIFALGIAFNVVGNLLLLPHYGATGAAMATLATQGLIALTQAVLAHRWLDVAAGLVGWPKILLLALILGTCGLALMYLDWPWLLEATMMGILGLAFALQTRLIDLEGTRKLMGEGP
ncbi:oligosaccharide flippase family protein [Lewinella sp. W8]|uniref:oligosaccharide flippase family protein n=1 Tax=Lewinella sp. W8 TaxID=2528208 RepID=UPI001068592E|nr:oligosaccharide flippase family protein [Lewinella sp. W8]MTB49415.1 oligosaccharide flippase family protein [Lewinella sp. W8]